MADFFSLACQQGSLRVGLDAVDGMRPMPELLSYQVFCLDLIRSLETMLLVWAYVSGSGVDLPVDRVKFRLEVAWSGVFCFKIISIKRYDDEIIIFFRPI